jgi:hypothetical protein
MPAKAKAIIIRFISVSPYGKARKWEQNAARVRSKGGDSELAQRRTESSTQHYPRPDDVQTKRLKKSNNSRPG